MKEAPGKWYAVYTRSRSEKKLYSLLRRKDITCFLPLTKELRQRSDRKKWVEQPLIPSYLFVRIPEKEYYNVLNTPGAVCYICFEGRPTCIPDYQITYLQNLIANRPASIDIHYGDIEEGEFVEVTSGPLRGVKGEVLQIRGGHRILIRFESLGWSVHAQIGMHEISPVHTKENYIA